MRLFWFLLLVVFVGATVIFAMQNDEMVRLQFFDWSLTASLAVFIAAVYLLGMVSGWTVVGMFKRSIHEITAGRRS
jgi:uncharacterized integral membrane protein